MKKLMMIGFGAMAAEVYAHLPQDLQLKWIVVPSRSIEKVQSQVSSEIQVISDIEQCDGEPDYVIEVAGQAAVKEHAQKVLAKGWTIGLISVGTLADNEFLIQLKQTAEKNDAHLHLLAGAIAGIDGISAAKEGGLQKVTYKGCKSPKSWNSGYSGPRHKPRIIFETKEKIHNEPNPLNKCKKQQSTRLKLQNRNKNCCFI